MTRTALWRLFLILLSPSLAHSANICHRGWRLYTPWKGPDVCVRCQQGQFMPVKLHTHRKCFPCTKIENPQLEILVSPCNSTHDTEIHCIEGYYRTQPSYPEDRGHCERCKECQFPKRSCQMFHDTVCCSGDDYGVYINKDGHPECVHECGPGQFLDNASDQCLPCPENSYMEENRHINNYCRHCEGPKSTKEVIVQPCNATHPTVLGCADGYYRQSETTTGSDHAECIKLCQKGQYLDLESETCRNCRENTYMDGDMHRFTKCKQCDLPTSVNERIVQPCIRTHPAMIGCVEGFYRQLSDDLSTSTCVQCRNCSENKDENIYQGRGCKPTRDTICCPRPDMEVVDTSNGPVCGFFHNKVTVRCGEGEYLATNTDPQLISCKPCPQGMYMDETHHISSTCKSCDEFPNRRLCGASTVGNDQVDTVPLAEWTIGLTVTVLLLLLIQLFFTYRGIKNKGRSGMDDSETQPLLGHIPAAQPGHWTMLVEYITSSVKGQIKSKEFISLPDFNFTYLPVPHSDNEMVDLIKGQAHLTVLVHVEGSSSDRPSFFPGTDKPYLYSDKKYNSLPHTGTGWVQRVKMYSGQPCPCEECKRLIVSQRKKSWGEVVICTAAKVVFDITEGKNCLCYFFYDTDDTNLRSCPSLKGALKVLSDTARDWCYMTFATHEEELLRQIDDIFTRYHILRRRIQVNNKLIADEETQSEISDKMKTKLETKHKDCLSLFEELKKRNKSTGHDMYTSLIDSLPPLNITSDGNSQRDLLAQISSNVQNKFNSVMGTLKVIQQNGAKSEKQEIQKRLIKYWEVYEEIAEVERFLLRAMSVLDGVSGDKCTEAKDIYKPRVDPTRNLTVIVSHPLGRSKQISVGYATGLHVFDHYSRYRYTNALVRGCEGARVFIIGRTRVTDHGHSSRQGWSGSWSDLVPAVADFSISED